MCSRNAHRSVLQFLMGTRTRLESTCRKKDSVPILHFPWASCAVFPTNVDLVVRKCFFCCLKPNCLHFCCFCTPFEKGHPLHLPAPLSADLALITTAPGRTKGDCFATKSPKSYSTTASELPDALTTTEIEDDIVGDLTHGESSHFPVEHPLLPLSSITRRSGKTTHVRKTPMCQI